MSPYFLFFKVSRLNITAIFNIYVYVQSKFLTTFVMSGLTVQCEASIILIKGLAETGSQFPM